MKSAGGSASLRDLVRMFRISFRLRPTYVSIANDAPEIGFELELVGVHGSVGVHVKGGCACCLRVLLVLLDLADQIPLEQQDSGQSAGPHCEKFIRYASAGADPEVVLSMTVSRRGTLEDVAQDRITQRSQDIRDCISGSWLSRTPIRLRAGVVSRCEQIFDRNAVVKGGNAIARGNSRPAEVHPVGRPRKPSPPFSVILPALLVLVESTFVPAQEATKEFRADTSIKVDVRLVDLNVTVTDETGRPYATLKPENFRIYDNGMEQMIHHFSSEDSPLHDGIGPGSQREHG